MSKRKSEQTNEPKSLRFHAGQESVEEEKADDMFDEAVEAMAGNLDAIPPELRRQSVMFMANQLISIAVGGDPIQIVGMLEVMKSNILMGNFDDLSGLEEEGEDFEDDDDIPR